MLPSKRRLKGLCCLSGSALVSTSRKQQLNTHRTIAHQLLSCTQRSQKCIKYHINIIIIQPSVVQPGAMQVGGKCRGCSRQSYLTVPLQVTAASQSTLHHVSHQHVSLTGHQHITMHRTGAASQVPTAAAQQGVDDHKVPARTTARC